MGRSPAAAEGHVTCVVLEQNRGFGAACNAGFERALSTWSDLGHVLLVNPDATVQPGCVEALLAGGINIFRAMRLLIPPAWQNIDTMDTGRCRSA